MKNFGIYDQDLKKEYTFEIETTDKIDIRTAEVSFEKNNNKYRIWFNGKLIHVCKSFKSIINRLNKLDKNFPLDNYSEIK